ncbi:hypothetical protein OIU34_19810 [Pararhizobium sp. BT-229]|uniref:hypothetical protein n=1 Tax=Pararhizobium sp. BT-229 TaxID=2986923 RepID=UPI0021F6FC74|nr:hypothetical protein [Pararhizobium sp. BT-229]MCV9964132.1 hypothetical protein [Pararhizobium sp. BT-229]
MSSRNLGLPTVEQMKRDVFDRLQDYSRAAELATTDKLSHHLGVYWDFLQSCHLPSSRDRWPFVQEYHRATRDFHEGMTMVDLLKAADTFDFVPVEIFSSPVCDSTMVLARAVDAQIMLAPIEQGRVHAIELHRWRSNALPSFSFENRQFGPTHGRLSNDRRSRRPLEFLATALRLDQANESHSPIARWWSAGSGAEQTLSWHHNLFTWDEIQHFRFKFGPLETVGQSRRDAIKGPWRDIFDLDRERSHYVEVPEMEAVLTGLTV